MQKPAEPVLHLGGSSTYVVDVAALPILKNAQTEKATPSGYGTDWQPPIVKREITKTADISTVYIPSPHDKIKTVEELPAPSPKRKTDGVASSGCVESK